MKKIYYLLLCCLSTIGVWAQPSSKYSLVVEMANGSTQTFQLSTRPNVTFQDNQFVISQAGSNVEFSMDNVSSFYFVDSNTGVESLRNDEVTVSYDGQNIVVSGATKGVLVTNLEGIAQHCKATRVNDNLLSVSLENLPSGVYVVSIGKNQNFKIVKK
jgi:hypothetical protein